MRRLAFIIVVLTAIGIGLVHIRRAETAARHRIQRLRLQQVRVRRRLWDQQVLVGQLTAPDEVRLRAEEMALDLTARRTEPLWLAEREPIRP